MSDPEVIECSWPTPTDDSFLGDIVDALTRPLVATGGLCHPTGLYYTIRRGVPVEPDPRLVKWVQKI